MALANIFQPKRASTTDSTKLESTSTIDDEKVKERVMVKPQLSKKCYSFPALQTGLKNKMESLCNDTTNQSLCDATFEIGPNRNTFHVVTALFAIHSSELDSLLRSHRGKTIVIEDITAECFKFLRLYFYALNPVISSQNVADILYAASKLKIGTLMAAAKEFILGISNIGDLLLVLSNLHRLTLYEMCNQKIVHDKLLQDAAPIFNSTNLNILPTELMIRLLQSAQFMTTKLTEEAIFEKCVTWAKYQAEVNRINSNKESSQSTGVLVDEVTVSEEDESGLVVEDTASIASVKEDQDWKNVITPILPYIRFPIMSGNYFASHVFEMKLLSSEDATMIMQWQFTKKENEALKYSTKIRVR